MGPNREVAIPNGAERGEEGNDEKRSEAAINSFVRASARSTQLVFRKVGREGRSGTKGT